MIRRLSPGTDLAAVRTLYDRAADYVRLETGRPPDDTLASEFFTDAPPGIDPATGLKLGLFTDGRLDAIADLGFGFPDPQDAYIGLLLIAADCRGRGLGPRLLGQIATAARTRGAPRLLVGVLQENPRGHAFWAREGFTEVLKTTPRLLGTKTHIIIRMERRL